MLTEAQKTNEFENGLNEPTDINFFVTKKEVEQFSGQSTNF